MTKTQSTAAYDPTQTIVAEIRNILKESWRTLPTSQIVGVLKQLSPKKKVRWRLYLLSHLAKALSIITRLKGKDAQSEHNHNLGQVEDNIKHIMISKSVF